MKNKKKTDSQNVVLLGKLIVTQLLRKFVKFQC